VKRTLSSVIISHDFGGIIAFLQQQYRQEPAGFF
jgi:hypothetical protein